MEERLKSHYESLSRAIGFIRLADAKAAPALALQIALVGTLAARFERYAPILSEETWGTESVALGALMGLYALLLISIVAIAASVYLPRNPRTGRSLIYFEDISALPFEEFKVHAGEMTPETIESQLLQQIHAVSGVASVKMRRVRYVYLLSAPSLVLWIVLLAWGNV